MQELGKFNLKIKVIANASFELYNITNKLSFIDSIQFISSSLDSLFKHLHKEISPISVKKLIITY